MEFPDTSDALIALLRNLGAPIALVILVGFALAGASWVQLGIGTVRGGRAAAKTVTDAFVQRTTQYRRDLLKFLGVAVVFCSVAVFGARLGLAYPMLFGATNVERGWLQILGSWDMDAAWYVIATAGSVLLLGLSQIGRIRFLRIVLLVGWVPVLLAGLGIGVQWTIGFAGSLIAVVLTGAQNDDYTVATTVACGVIASMTILPIWLGSHLLDTSERLKPAAPT